MMMAASRALDAFLLDRSSSSAVSFERFADEVVQRQQQQQTHDDDDGEKGLRAFGKKIATRYTNAANGLHTGTSPEPEADLRIVEICLRAAREIYAPWCARAITNMDIHGRLERLLLLLLRLPNDNDGHQEEGQQQERRRREYRACARRLKRILRGQVDLRPLVNLQTLKAQVDALQEQLDATTTRTTLRSSPPPAVEEGLQAAVQAMREALDGFRLDNLIFFVNGFDPLEWLEAFRDNYRRLPYAEMADAERESEQNRGVVGYLCAWIRHCSTYPDPDGRLLDRIRAMQDELLLLGGGPEPRRRLCLLQLQHVALCARSARDAQEARFVPRRVAVAQAMMRMRDDASASLSSRSRLLGTLGDDLLARIAHLSLLPPTTTP